MAINGSIVKPGDVVNFTYSGDIQEWIVPVDGLYKLEVWGASGGIQLYGTSSGKGGYSVGYKELKKGTVLYIVVGQKGRDSGNTSPAYNGGGGGSADRNPPSWARWTFAGGGGATHIALVSGTLKNIGYTSFVTDKNGLIVAGGGGGACLYTDGNGTNHNQNGGSGGGLSGGSSSAAVSSFGWGGTQTSGNAFGYGGEAGGGGLYGGRGSNSFGGGGGSGYIDGVPEITYGIITYVPNTQNGVWSGDGKAAITLIEKVGLNNILAFGDEDIGMVVGDLEITGISFGDILL